MQNRRSLWWPIEAKENFSASIAHQNPIKASIYLGDRLRLFSLILKASTMTTTAHLRAQIEASLRIEFRLPYP